MVNGNGTVGVVGIVPGSGRSVAGSSFLTGSRIKPKTVTSDSTEPNLSSLRLSPAVQVEGIHDALGSCCTCTCTRPGHWLSPTMPRSHSSRPTLPACPGPRPRPPPL